MQEDFSPGTIVRVVRVVVSDNELDSNDSISVRSTSPSVDRTNPNDCSSFYLSSPVSLYGSFDSLLDDLDQGVGLSPGPLSTPVLRRRRATV